MKTFFNQQNNDTDTGKPHITHHRYFTSRAFLLRQFVTIVYSSHCLKFKKKNLLHFKYLSDLKKIPGCNWSKILVRKKVLLFFRFLLKLMIGGGFVFGCRLKQVRFS